MKKASCFLPIFLLACAACQSPPRQNAPAAGAAPPGSRFREAATGFFVSPNLVLTNRHVFRQHECQGIKALSSDGALGEADLELVGFPANSEIDLALYRLMKGNYPAAPVVLHSFDGAPNTIAEANAAILTYPYPFPIYFEPRSNMAVAHADAVALMNARDVAKKAQLTIDEEGTITRGAASALSLPAGQRIMLYSRTAKIIVLYSTALRPGASGSPIVDAKGRLIGVVKGEAESLFSKDFGVAVDAADVAPFLEANGVDAREDDQKSGPGNDLSRNVVRLFCFGS